MEKELAQSSRFISLSGLSGVSVGISGLFATYIAHRLVASETKADKDMLSIVSGFDSYNETVHLFVGENLIFLSIFTILFALLFSFYFTTAKSKKNNLSIWDGIVKRQLSVLSLPLIIGGIFISRLISTANFGFIIPVALIFYALSLINLRKYTSGDVAYLGYALLILGIVNLWIQRLGILFFALGFGIFHIIYGVVTFYFYERHTVKSIRNPKGKW